MDKSLLTLQQVADMLHVHPETLRRWDRSKRLVAVKVGDRGDRRYRLADIQRLMASIAPTKYKEFEIAFYSPGFEMFPDRFGSIAKFVVKKPDLVVGFAFAVAGLELFASPETTDQHLEKLAKDEIKNYIDNGNLTHKKEHTFEFLSGHFVEVENPVWWKSQT
jgi:excisionase family DNA binding protein